VAVALPSLALAGVGLTHPLVLNPATAHHWWSMHVWLVPVFGLIAVSLWVLLRDAVGPIAWLARIAAYGYATFYTALDVLSGIGAGLVVDSGQGGPAVLRLLAVGDRLGLVGSVCLLVAVVLTTVALWSRAGLWVIPAGLLLLVGGWLFLGNHIFRPWGVAGQLAIALGLAILGLTSQTHRRSARAAVSR
jgi:hypothetical protein